VLTGQRNPLHATGLGKALLSGLTGEERRTLLTTLTPYTNRTLTSHEALDAELAKCTARGYFTEVEELAHGRACVAAAIRDSSGAVIAGLSVSGPLSAIDLQNREQALASTVIEAADSISIGLGYVGPHHIPAQGGLAEALR
jgi:DNA-binding IclR family transcriptional regulator